MLPRPPHLLLAGIICLALAACATGNAQTPAASVGSSAAPSASATETAALTTPRSIELQLTPDLRITQDGSPVADIPVKPGETIHFVLTNTAGFDHDFYIGPGDALAAGRVADLPGVATWSSSQPKEFDWVVPTDVDGLEFGCTLRGHYPTMHGTFSAAT